MGHEANIIAKGAKIGRAEVKLFLLCGNTAHINNTTCSHPALLDFRLLHRRDIDDHILSLRHTVLPPAQSLLMHLKRSMDLSDTGEYITRTHRLPHFSGRVHQFLALAPAFDLSTPTFIFQPASSAIAQKGNSEGRS